MIGSTVVAIVAASVIAFGSAQHRGRSAVSPATGTTTSLPPPTTLAPPNLASYRVFYSDPDGVRVVPLDGSKATVVVPGPGQFGATMRVIGGAAFLHAGSAYFLSDSTPATPRRLGAADHLVAALGGGELLGLAVDTLAVTVVFVNLAGGPAPPSVQLPAGYQPLAQVDSGMLVSDSNGEIRVWLTRTKTLGPVIGDAAIATLGDNVAWRAVKGCDSSPECPLHITDTSSGKDRVIAAPPGHGGFISGGAFSPDGRLFAGFISAPSDNSPAAQLVVVDLGPSIAVVITAGIVPVGEPIGYAVWVPDGSHLFFGGLHGPLHDYEAGATRATALGVPSSYSFTVLGP